MNKTEKRLRELLKNARIAPSHLAFEVDVIDPRYKKNPTCAEFYLEATPEIAHTEPCWVVVYTDDASCEKFLELQKQFQSEFPTETLICRRYISHSACHVAWFSAKSSRNEDIREYLFSKDLFWGEF
jgi:hypothetical protein